jgi:membrane-associated protein
VFDDLTQLVADASAWAYVVLLLAWAERRLGGGELIAVGRFIPGGRTAVTLTAGSLHFPWPRFLVLDAAAGLGWALYAALLGFFGGEAFEHAPWKGLALALGVALALVAVVELVRLLRRRRLES